MHTFRGIPCTTITKTIRELFIKANTALPPDVLAAVKAAASAEKDALARYSLELIVENAAIASGEGMPLCQDTGLAVVFVELGQDVHVVGGNLNEAIQQGVKEAYHHGYMRKSVCDPLTRANTRDNTPAIIHVDVVDGDRLKLIAMPKGGGSENMSASVMLVPAEGREGIKKFVVDRVRHAGPNPCPPVIIGVGIGGSLEQSAVLAKKALLRPLGERHRSDERVAALEAEIFEEVNAIGIGPHGYGGDTTALAVHVEMMPCHIASLPVTVNIQCHVARHAEAVL
jgi:fumarate hydratase subunit alpha